MEKPVDKEEAEASKMRGVSLPWVLSSFMDVVEEKHRAKDSSVAAPSKDDIKAMDFRYLSDVVAKSETGLGYGKRCPRDGKAGSSIVDALYDERRSKGNGGRAHDVRLAGAWWT